MRRSRTRRGTQAAFVALVEPPVAATLAVEIPERLDAVLDAQWFGDAVHSLRPEMGEEGVHRGGPGTGRPAYDTVAHVDRPERLRRGLLLGAPLFARGHRASRPPRASGGNRLT